MHRPRLADERAGETAVVPGDVFVAPSTRHGRGVFAARAFEAGELIEVCPVLVLPAGEQGTSDTVLWDHAYEWADGGGAIALGFGSLYNHAWEANARYEHDYDAGLIRVYAVVPIAEGEEVTINYTGTPVGTGDLWFEAQ